MNRTALVAGVAGLAIGAAATYAAVSAAGDATNGMGSPSDRMSRMEMSGDMSGMMRDHTAMLRGIRADMTPEMRKRMDRDEMSQMMMSGEMQQMMDDHESQMGSMMGGR